MAAQGVPSSGAVSGHAFRIITSVHFFLPSLNFSHAHSLDFRTCSLRGMAVNPLPSWRLRMKIERTTQALLSSLRQSLRSCSSSSLAMAAAFARTAARRTVTARYSSFRAASGSSTFDLHSYMLAKSRQVNDALESALSVHKLEIWHPAATKLHDAMRYSLLNPRSKRVCSIACIAASELVGGDQSGSMPAACSLEMLHTMAIIHDDLPCMDDAQLRRGKPACHRAFGDDLALLAGDALLAMAFEHLASASSSAPAQLLKVTADLEMASSAGWKGMAAGQAVDLASANDPDVTLATVEFVHVHKTSKLLQASLVCGAILGGAADQHVESLRTCGLHAGLMYQIVDDILDVTRSSEQLGKMAGSDLASGKATYPSLVGLEESRLLVQRLQEKAKEQLAGFDEEKATALLHFVDFIASRQR